MKTKANKKITYGSVELDKEEFDPKNTKIRVTTFIDLDVVLELKKRAKRSRTKYQSLLNQILRDSVFGPKNEPPLSESKLRSIIKEELKLLK